MLTVDTIPLRTLPIANFRLPITSCFQRQLKIGDWQSEMLLGLFMIRVLTAAPAKFTELQTIRGCLLVLCRDVVAAFAVRALKYNVVARHKSSLQLQKSLCSGIQISQISNLKFEI